MKPLDIKYADKTLDAFVTSAIHRVAETGTMTYKFKVTASEVKAQTERERLRAPVIKEFENYFADHQVEARYDESVEAFTVTVDLEHVVLTPGQANFLSTAMQKHQADIN